MKETIKSLVYKVTGTTLVTVSKGLDFMSSQLEKAGEEVSNVGNEMLYVANGEPEE